MRLYARVAIGMILAIMLSVAALGLLRRFVIAPELRPEVPATMLLAAIVVPIAVAVVAAMVLVVPVTRRLRALERTTRLLAGGDLAARAVVGPRDAIGNLAERFNQMACEIQQLVDSKRQLLQAVSHEFRTPTSRIRFALEMLETSRTDDERRDMLTSIDDSLVEIDELVDELLTYVRFEGTTPELPTEELDPRGELEAMVASVRGLRREVEVEITAHDEDEPTHIVANRRYFRRALSNLVHNAVRHAESRVRIEYQRVGDDLVVLVHDDGPGVPADQRAHVFEPFARLDNSRSRDSGGVGLGLAIVQRILEWHGGSVNVEDSSPLGGAMFVSVWPTHAAAS